MILDYWPLFALGLLCGGLAVRAWWVMTAPEPRDPRRDWAEWETVRSRRMGPRQ